MSKNKNQEVIRLICFRMCFINFISNTSQIKAKFNIKACGKIVQRQIFNFLTTKHQNRLK